jgi:hypothetical protein
MAWAALAPFCGALPARPAIFFTGASKSGKSTVLDYIVTPLARPRRYSGVSTAAGIRQDSANDSAPQLIDEAESHDDDSRKRMNDHFELMRQSVFPNSPKIVKGSTSQRAQSYETSNIYMYGAITPGLERTADLNRIILVDMVRPEQDGRWPVLRAALLDTFSPANCAAVRSYTWAHLPQIIDAVEDFTALVGDVASMSSRDALIDAVLWTAHWIVWRDRVPEEAELREWLAAAYLVKPREEPEDDADAMLNRLLNEAVPVFDAPTKRYTLGHLLGSVLSGQEERDDYTEPLADTDRERYRRTCWQYGLYVLPKTREVAVAVRRQAVARILGSTLAYSMTMARHPLCTDKARRVTQDGPTKVCLAYSSGILEGDPPI